MGDPVDLSSFLWSFMLAGDQGVGQLPCRMWNQWWVSIHELISPPRRGLVLSSA